MSVRIETPRLLIAAPHSGAGKTTITMGLAAWLSQEMTVMPFKVGPDYIDPGYLTAGAGVPAVNLDGWLLTRERVKQVFWRHAAGAEMALIEGVMGLFDGRGSGPEGSAAQIAQWLDAPVILVVDASGSSRSLAALVSGFAAFDKRVKIAGVILNRIGGPGHLSSARQSIERDAGVPVIAYLPNNPQLAAPERHLGLVQLPKSETVRLARQIGSELATTCNRDMLLKIAAGARPVALRKPTAPPTGRRVNIGLARDDAFSFYYADNLRLIETLGGHIVNFSPLNDAELPRDIGGLFIGGGWPELHAVALSANKKMLSSVLAAAEAGLPIYAECGGLIYLTKSLRDQGRSWPMVGLLPATAAMTGRRQSLGYRQARFARRTILGQKGTPVRGHEFHWSVIEPSGQDGFDRAYEFTDGCFEGFASDNILASYLHLNWNSCPELAKNFINSCRGARLC